MSGPPAEIDLANRGIGNAASVGARPFVRAASLVFLAMVAILIVAPFIQTVAPIFPNLVAPLEERRQPSPFPDPDLLFKVDGEFASQLNAWFDDRVGFRDLLIRGRNQIDYSVFATSRKVHIGRDGWLFDRGPADSLGRLTAAQMAELQGSFVALADLLAQRGIRLVVVGHPQKIRVYPEMAAPGQSVPEPNDNTDKLRQFLANEPSLIFVDAEAILARMKAVTRQPLYRKTDLHPTEVGTLPVVEEIIARIAEAEGRPDIRWREDFRLTHESVGPGNEGRALAPLFPIHEDLPYYEGRFRVGHEEADGTWQLLHPNARDVADDGVGRPYDFGFRSRPDLCPQRLPDMVLFGNSFSDGYWELGLHRYFCATRRARNPISRFKLFYDTMPEGTKYFIFQYLDAWLPHEPPPISQIRKSG